MEFTFNFYPSNQKPMYSLNMSVGNENCKRQYTSYTLEMDQNLELRDLGKNTANEIPGRETDGREKNLLDFELAALDELAVLAALVNEEPCKNNIKNNQDTLSNKGNQWSSTFSKASNLRTHMKKHSGEKSNKCNQCDYASSYASALKRHLKMHSGEKSNKCNQCGYASSYASCLKTHMKMHNGKKSNKCNLCDYASFQAGNLRTHLKTHSGEKSNKCNLCDFVTSWPSALKKHLKIQRKDL